MSTRRYVSDKRFGILAISIAVGAGPVTFYWADAHNPKSNLVVARQVLESAADAGKIFVSHNIGFDGLIAQEKWNLRYEKYFDTAGYARFLAVGGSLKAAALFMGYQKLGTTSIDLRLGFRTDVESLDTVLVDLPTERSLHYRAVRLHEDMGEYGYRKTIWYAPRLSRLRIDSVGSRPKKARRFEDGIIRVPLTQQVLVENVVQAIARDIMVHQAIELENVGLPVAFHAHDEIVALCPKCGCNGTCTSNCAWAYAGIDLNEIMSRVPRTLPRLSGLPLACEVSPTIRERYGV